MKKKVDPIEVIAKQILVRATKNAKSRSIPIDLDIEYIKYLLNKSEGRCMVTGIPFDLTLERNGQRRPWGPSLDRINSELGYGRRNCRIVCAAANLAMNHWGEPVLAHLAHAYLNRKEMGETQAQEVKYASLAERELEINRLKRNSEHLKERIEVLRARNKELVKALRAERQRR